MRIAGQGNGRLCSAVEADLRNRAAVRLQRGELLFQPQARGDKDLVVAAATGVHTPTGIAETFGETRLDRRMTVFVAIVQHEGAAAKVFGQRVQFSLQCRGFVSRDHMDVGEAFDMRLAGRDVVQEKFAIQQDVVTGEKRHDACIRRHTRLLPQKISHELFHPNNWRQDGYALRSAMARRPRSKAPADRH